MAVNEWDRRELCPDGSCTGLIGPEGTCKVCGHVAPNWGDERKRGIVDDADDDDDDDAAADDDPIAPTARAEIGGGEWQARQLCADGGCTGLIGADGTCKVCGKPGTAPVAGASDDELADDEEWDDSEDAEDEADDELEAAADELAGIKPLGAAADDDENRQLCADGGCIGVIGSDGKCKVCGKEAA